MKPEFLFIFSILMPSLCSAANTDPFDVTSFNSQIRVYPGKPSHYVIHNSSAWAQDIRILGRTHSDDSCNTIGFYSVNLTKPPVHGAICVRHEDGRVRFNDRGLEPKCKDKPALFTVIYYEPFFDFAGIDRFEYTIGDEKNDQVTTAEVTMNVAPRVSAEKSVRDFSEHKTQDAGVVGLCQALAM